MKELTSATRMRILIVSPNLPYPPHSGLTTRVFQILKHLAERHCVTLLSYAAPDNDRNVAVLQKICKAVHTVTLAPPGGALKRAGQLRSIFSSSSYHQRSARSAAMQAMIDRVLANGQFHCIQVETSQMAGHQFDCGPLLVLVEHDIGHELLQRMAVTERSLVRSFYNNIERKKFLFEELQAWDRADACVVMSERERKLVNEHRPGKLVKVVPNGVDTDYFNLSPRAPTPDSIVFTGLMSTRPNTDAAVYFVREILPRIHRVRPEATFTIVGARPSAEVQRLAGPRVTVTGEVPDVREYVHAAAVMAVPLRMGSGTRLKVLEGSAMGKAIVSTSLGCEGIDVLEGVHLLVADDPDSFAEAVLLALADRELAARLGRQARVLAEERYDWSIIARELERWYVQLLDGKRSGSTYRKAD